MFGAKRLRDNKPRLLERCGTSICFGEGKLIGCKGRRATRKEIIHHHPPILDIMMMGIHFTQITKPTQFERVLKIHNCMYEFAGAVLSDGGGQLYRATRYRSLIVVDEKYILYGGMWNEGERLKLIDQQSAHFGGTWYATKLWYMNIEKKESIGDVLPVTGFHDDIAVGPKR